MCKWMSALLLTWTRSSSSALRRRRKLERRSSQRAGKWRHLWRIAGRYANISVLDVKDHDELHAILSSLPLFPYMQIVVMPLARHPSAIGDT